MRDPTILIKIGRNHKLRKTSVVAQCQIVSDDWRRVSVLFPGGDVVLQLTKDAWMRFNSDYLAVRTRRYRHIACHMAYVGPYVHREFSRVDQAANTFIRWEIVN